jgi:hypothetical protein
MKYGNATKLLIILFSASFIKEPTPTLQLVKSKDYVCGITNLKLSHHLKQSKNKHYSCFRPIMMLMERIIAGPKTNINVVLSQIHMVM